VYGQRQFACFYRSPLGSHSSFCPHTLAKHPLANEIRPRALSELPKSWSWLDIGLLLRLNLVHVLHDDVIPLALVNHYDVPLSRHYGIAKTVGLQSLNFWFPGMAAFVRQHVPTSAVTLNLLIIRIILARYSHWPLEGHILRL
jgi:hypothetical protein